jgi:hypothetical protein
MIYTHTGTKKAMVTFGYNVNHWWGKAKKEVTEVCNADNRKHAERWAQERASELAGRRLGINDFWIVSVRFAS